MVQYNKSFQTKVVIDNYEIRLVKGQIGLYNMDYGTRGVGELVRAIDIKSVTTERDEFNSFVERFTKGHEARKERSAQK